MYEVLGRNREFFVAHRATLPVLLAYVALVSFVIPGLLALVVAGLTALRRRSGQVLQLAVVGLLFAVIASEILTKSAKLSATPHVGLALATGIAGAWAYATLPIAGTFLSVLSASIVAFPAIFLLQPSMATFVRPKDGTERAAAALGPTRPPIVVAIFDQLPLTSLMADDDTIDVERYPGFASLAADATWYRNASTAAELTGWAIPPIVSGMRPRPAALPTSRDYPDNLFTALARGYNYEVEEPITDFCPDRLCNSDLEPLPVRLVSMLLDSSVVVLHLMAPADLELFLPPLTQDWRNFVRAQQWTQRWVSRRDNDRRVGPREWLVGISGSDPQPTLYYLHALLPHEPYFYLPNGQQVGGDGRMPGLNAAGHWSVDDWAVVQAYQRHLLQVGYVDHVVGDLVARLKQEGLWDRALVIVTADHGVSFRAGKPFKEIDDDTLPDIMSVPLFVKLPGEHGPSVSDRNVQSVDLLPTIADVMDLQLPWNPDGRSILLDPPPAATKRIQYYSAMEQRDIDTGDLAQLRRKAVHRRAILFDLHDPDLVPSMSVHRELIGRRLDSLQLLDEPGITVTLDQAARFLAFDPGAPQVLSRLDGAVQDAKGHPIQAHLAVAVNGVVQATTRTYVADAWPEGRWRVFLSPHAFTKGLNTVNIFVIKDAPGGVRLDEAFALHAGDGRPVSAN